VGHDEEPLSPMGPADVGHTYATPVRVIPRLGQVSENDSEPAGEKSPNVLDHHDPRL
jgi:hypothetical protein